MPPRPLTAVLLLVLAPFALGQAAPQNFTQATAHLRTFATPYYILHTDLGEADAREADLRLTRMFEEYQRRTAGFAGQVREKFPFYLFNNPIDYYAADGIRGSAGVFLQTRDGSRLMALVDGKADNRTWHIVQHEGFHQFVHATIAHDIPPWVNEGLAEYFGECFWTGDGFVSGLINPNRLDNIKAGIQKGTFHHFADIMSMTGRQWNDDLNATNYDEAWAMIHFIAHADNGRYQAPFLQYMKQVSDGVPTNIAWNNIFGKDTLVFETRFSQWWLALPEDPTRDGHLQAVIQTQTSFLARATLQKQTFPDATAFFKTFTPAGLAVNRDLWLPPHLFEETRDAAMQTDLKWTLDTPKNQTPRLVGTHPDGTVYTGSFVLNAGRVTRVAVQVTLPPKTLPSLKSPLSPSR